MASQKQSLVQKVAETLKKLGVTIQLYNSRIYYSMVVCVTYDKTNRSRQETIGKVSNILFDNTPRLHLTKFSLYQSSHNNLRTI